MDWTQSAMGASLVPLIWLAPVDEFGWWRALLLVHAVAASTQDVAIDALAINAVPADARGQLNGAMQAGMLVGRSVFGGGVLLVGASFGRQWIVGSLAAWILIALAGALMLREAEPARRAGAFADTLATAFRLRTTWIGLAFALVSAAAFEATGQLAGPFLVDRGAATGTIGFFFGVVVVGAMLAGGLTGGALSDRCGRVQAAAGSLAAFVSTIVLLALVDLAGAADPAPLMSVLAAMYFFVGFFTAVSYALFMDLTDPRLGATQFSTFMAATNGCESWSVWTSGPCGRSGSVRWRGIKRSAPSSEPWRSTVRSNLADVPAT